MCTDGFEKKYGHQARENIMAALAALEPPPVGPVE